MNIKIKALSKSYDKEIIKAINLEVEAYKTVAIIGKSGCGKSTLLRLLTGIESADKGSIMINDDDIWQNIRKYQNRISLVFQQHNLFPHLSLLENITLILEKIKKHSKEEALEIGSKLLTQLHLESVMHKRPRFVSGGQAQRASIARALATNPEIIFMDEPTAALDPLLTKEVLDAVLELKTMGKKFVFVTHEISFVKNFAEYVVFMDEGKIIEHGPIEILKDAKTGLLEEFLSNERG